MSSPKLSAYELVRQATIARNNEKLEELGLGPSGSAVLTSTSANSPPLQKKRKKPPAVREPTRKSTRSKHAPDVYVVEESDNGKVRVGGRDAAALEAEAEPITKEIDLDDLPIEKDMLLEYEQGVYEELRAARNAKARAMERSMFIVCNDRSLCEMVRTLPTSAEELVELFGMGPKKVAAHGTMLLATLEPHLDRLRAEHETWRRSHQAPPQMAD